MKNLLLILFGILTFASCSKDEPIEDINSPIKHINNTKESQFADVILMDVGYGPDSLNTMDVYLPKGRNINTKFVILLHGGAWKWGDKSADGLGYLRLILLERGFAVATINYRRACGDFHKQMEDVGMVIGYLSSHSGEWICDSDDFGLMGRSSGAHLALLYTHAFDTANVVKTVVSIVGPTDMGDPDFLQFAEHNGFLTNIHQLLGATYAANPQVYYDASPIHHISDKPTFLLCGSQDTIVPYHQSIRMYDELKANGIPTDTTVFYNAGHNILGQYDVNRGKIEAEVGTWFSQYLY